MCDVILKMIWLVTDYVPILIFEDKIITTRMFTKWKLKLETHKKTLNCKLKHSVGNIGILRTV